MAKSASKCSCCDVPRFSMLHKVWTCLQVTSRSVIYDTNIKTEWGFRILICQNWWERLSYLWTDSPPSFGVICTIDMTNYITLILFSYSAPTSKALDAMKRSSSVPVRPQVSFSYLLFSFYHNNRQILMIRHQLQY